MKKLLSFLLVAMLAFSLMPLAFADGADTGVPGGVVIDQPEDVCSNATFYIDHTARGWRPNDQTYYTAEEYGALQEGGKYSCEIEDADFSRYVLEERMNYVFEGENIDYYVVVRDEDGISEDDLVQLVADEEVVGACASVDPESQCENDLDSDAFGIEYNSDTDQLFICSLIVPDNDYNNDGQVDTWADGEKESSIVVTDDESDVSCDIAVVLEDVETDLLFFNPDLSLTVVDAGQIDFGSVAPGGTATSNSIYLRNSAEEDSGVIMDIYIASDDYFTDPDNPYAVCPTGNGIRYDRFSYYATKGALNSGANNALFEGLGAGDGEPDREDDICEARGDEFTPLPSHSGHIEDMCRVINWRKGASLLTEGSEMSIRFRLDVPETCVGSFDQGQFHFKGRVV